MKRDPRGGVGTQIGRVERQLAVLSTSLNRRFDVIDDRFDAVDQRFDTVDKRFDAIDERVEGVDKRFDAIDEGFGGVDKRLVGIDARFRHVDTWFEETTEALAEQRRYTEFAFERLSVEI